MDDRLKKALGLRISIARKAAGYTQYDLAECIDRSFESISNIERGNTVPPIPTLLAISRCLKVPMQELIATLDDSIIDGVRAKSRSRIELEGQVVEAIQHMDDVTLRQWYNIAKVLMHKSD